MDFTETQIRFTGERDPDGRWLAVRTAGEDRLALTFPSLAAAAELARAEGWSGGVSIAQPIYEAMLDAGDADLEGALPDNVTPYRRLRSPGRRIDSQPLY